MCDFLWSPALPALASTRQSRQCLRSSPPPPLAPVLVGQPLGVANPERATASYTQRKTEGDKATKGPVRSRHRVQHGQRFYSFVGPASQGPAKSDRVTRLVARPRLPSRLVYSMDDRATRRRDDVTPVAGNGAPAGGSSSRRRTADEEAVVACVRGDAFGEARLPRGRRDETRERERELVGRALLRTSLSERDRTYQTLSRASGQRGWRPRGTSRRPLGPASARSDVGDDLFRPTGIDTSPEKTGQ